MVAAGSVQADDTPQQRAHLVFGFLPIVSTERLVERFSPLVDYLAAALVIEIRMETAPDFDAFVVRTREARYDILFTAPHLYYLAHQDSGYRLLARVDKESMKAVVVVPAESKIRSVEDLRGQTLATTGPLALATTLVKERLVLAGLQPDRDLTLVSTPSHNASLLSAYQGTTAASALMLPVYRRADPDIIRNTRIIAETRSVPHIPIAVHPRVDTTAERRIRQALLDLGSDEAGQALLEQLGWPGFTVGREEEYSRLQWLEQQVPVQ